MLIMITLKEMSRLCFTKRQHPEPVKEATERRIGGLRENVHSEHANSKHGRVPRAGRLCAPLIIIAEEMRVGTKLNENIWGDAEARHQYL